MIATVERSTPPSLGTNTPGDDSMPAMMRWRNVGNAPPAVMVPVVDATIALIAARSGTFATAVLSRTTCGGAYPVAVWVKIVRQLPVVPAP